jgi:hypothetical protein
MQKNNSTKKSVLDKCPFHSYNSGWKVCGISTRSLSPQMFLTTFPLEKVGIRTAGSNCRLATFVALLIALRAQIL